MQINRVGQSTIPGLRTQDWYKNPHKPIVSFVKLVPAWPRAMLVLISTRGRFRLLFTKSGQIQCGPLLWQQPVQFVLSVIPGGWKIPKLRLKLEKHEIERTKSLAPPSLSSLAHSAWAWNEVQKRGDLPPLSQMSGSAPFFKRCSMHSEWPSLCCEIIQIAAKFDWIGFIHA